jgi:hypothetical protein
MKKLFIAFVFVFILQSAQSQLTKGNWLVGGSGSFYSSNTFTENPVFRQKAEEFNLSVVPTIGYFFIDKFVVGLSPNFSWGKGTNGDAIDANGNIIGSGASSNIKRFLIGPFARYYLLDTEKPYNILIGASYQYGIYSSKPTTGKLNTFSVAAGPVIYFNSSVGLEFTLGYTSRIDDIKDNYKTTQKGLQIGIGFQIHLEKE